VLAVMGATTARASIAPGPGSIVTRSFRRPVTLIRTLARLLIPTARLFVSVHGPFNLRHGDCESYKSAESKVLRCNFPFYLVPTVRWLAHLSAARLRPLCFPRLCLRRYPVTGCKEQRALWQESHRSLSSDLGSSREQTHELRLLRKKR